GLKSREQQVAYVSKLGKDLPNLAARAGAPVAVDTWSDTDFKQPKPKPKPRPKPARRTLIPRDCYLTVSNAKIAEITKELRGLVVADFPHSVSVLFRVFLEQSVDHYLTTGGISLEEAVGSGRKRDKNLRTKV